MTLLASKPRPTCSSCGRRPVRRKGTTKHGFEKWGRKCLTCTKKPYAQHKRGSCEFCGFVPVHECQLDVDHVDGDHENNDPKNLQTLCANCHRLKTCLHGDWQGD